MSLVAHAESVQGLTRAFAAATTAMAACGQRLQDVVGPGDTASATMLAKFFTRLESGKVGTQNATEAEIQRRQFTRVGAERGLVGVQNVTEAEIQRRQFTRVGAESGLVGNFNPVYAEISRRMFTRLDGVSRGDQALVGIYLQFFTRLMVRTLP
jgi:hypothetical protein